MNLGFHNENIKFLDHIGMADVTELTNKKIALKLNLNFKDNINAQNIYILCANLLARLFINIDFIIPESTQLVINESNINIPLSEYVLSLVKNIFKDGNYNFYTKSISNKYDGILTIGNCNKSNVYETCIISNGWNIYINKNNINSFNINPIGACAAACFGVSELFKKVMRTNSKPINEMEFSLLNYNYEVPLFNPELPESIDIGEVTLIGAGAIGSSFIYSLNCLKNVKGRLNVVDNDKYTESNLNRYIISNNSTIDLPKVNNVENLLMQHTDIDIKKFFMNYDEFKKTNRKVDTIITAVDKRITRYNIQGDLPKLIIDSSTTNTYIDLHRVDFGSGGACLGCLYEPDEQDELQYNYISERTGISLERVKLLYDTNQGLNEDDISIASQKINKDLSFYINQPIDTLYSHVYCGSAIIENAKNSDPIVAPISFISALAGTFVTSELIKARYFPEYVIKNHFCINTFSSPNPSLHKYINSDKNCKYCGNKDFIDAYKEKWEL
jgi:molybdopterin/thiamine biosynthesis adenylyltransferase